MLRAAIFDMDGLLIDSEPLWRDAERDVFATVGIDITDELAEATNALRTDAVTEHWFNYQPWIGPSLLDIENAVIDRVGELIRARGTMLPGVIETLDYFATRGYRLGLASNSPDVLIATATRKLGIHARFEVLSSSVHERLGKPDPAVYLTTAAKLGVQAAQCIVFEDSAIGVQAGKAAGMKTVAVPPAAHYADQSFAIADLKLPSLALFKPAHEAALFAT